MLINYITSLLYAIGYPGLALAMVMESMIVPLPSEAVMPLAGFLWSQGKMSFGLILFWSTAGSLIGSFLSYYMGFYGGRPLILRLGHYLFLNESHLRQTEDFFHQHGARAIFFGRFIPVVRHLISIPAGLGRMNLWLFSFYTIFGALLWNAFLTIVGYYLGANWGILKEYGHYLDIAVVAAIIVLIGWWFWSKRKGVEK